MLIENKYTKTPPGKVNFSEENPSAFVAYDEALFYYWANLMDQGYAPIDPFTGIPLPIAPADPPSNIPQIKQFEDNHHAYFWKNHPELRDFAGRTVRHSRLIRWPRWSHEYYHQTFPNGLAWLPQTRDEKFKTVTFSSSGLIPEYAVDVTHKKYPIIVNLGREAITYLQSPERVFPEARIDSRTERDDYKRRRGAFLMQCALENGFDDVDLTLLKRFMEEKDESMRRHLGMMVISAYIENASRPVTQQYVHFAERGLLPPQKPRTPRRLINNFTANTRLAVLPEIAERAKIRLDTAA